MPAVLLFFFILFISGCGTSENPGPKGTAHGKVTMGGKNLPNGYFVILHQLEGRGVAWSSPILADGTFSLNGKQLPIGKYGVGATHPTPPPLTDVEINEKGMKPAPPPVIIPNKYLSGDTSDKFIEIKENADTEVNVDLPEK